MVVLLWLPEVDFMILINNFRDNKLVNSFVTLYDLARLMTALTIGTVAVCSSINK